MPSLELEDALAAAVDGRPALLKQFLHKRLKDVITARFEEGEPVQPAQVAALLAELESQLGAGYPKRRRPVTASP